MKMKTIARLMPALALGVAAGQAGAAGFQLLEQNASGIGNAYSGSAAVAENASTIFFNPAGMTQLKEREISAGITAVRPTFKFDDRGSLPGALTGTGNGGDAGSWAFLPNAYLSWGVTKDVYVGLGLGAPFGLVTEYHNPWVGGAHALKFDIKTYNINPSIAWRVNDKVSLGAGASYQKMEVEYVRLFSVSSPALAGTSVKLGAEDWAWGWNVGALFTLSPTTKVGVSYRSKVRHDLQGDLKSSGTAAASIGNSPASARVDLPDTFILSVAQTLSDRWEMLGDISWTGWSSIQNVDIMRYSSGTGSLAQRLDTQFRDTWRFALGTNYKLNETVKLKFGIAYDQTPVRSDETRLVSLPDSNRTWLSTGAQIKVNKDSTVDLGAAYIKAGESHIYNDQRSTNPLVNRGLVSGVNDARVWLLGAQYSMAF